MIVLRAAALIVCVFVPGWLGVSLLKAGDETLKKRERLFLVFALGTGIISLWALVLALLGAYSLTALLLTVGATSVALALAARRRVLWIRGLGLKDVALALAIVAIALVLFAPPWSIVFGWSDVGVYANIATHVEEEGGFSVHNEVASRVDEGRRDLLYYRESNRASPDVYFENQFFIIDDFESGTTRPWFYFLWPSLMAVFASFLGVSAQYWAITAAAVLALWGFFVLACRLLGWRWAIAAAALFALSPLTMYFSHYTSSETMNQFLFIAGSLCLLAYLRGRGQGGSRGLAVFSAIFYSLGFLCRIDFVFLAVPVFICYAVRGLGGSITADDYWFLAVIAAGAAFAVLSGLVFSGVYFRAIWSYFFRLPGQVFWIIASLLVVAVGLAVILGKKLRKRSPKPAVRSFGVPVLWLVLCAAFIYLYFIRPLGAQEIVGYGFIREARGPSYINQSLIRWAWYMSFAGVGAVFVGYGVWLTRHRGFGESTLGFTGLAYTLLYAWNMQTMPMHILAMRRLMPVVFPMAVMIVIYALKSLVHQAGMLGSLKYARWTRVLAGVFAAAFSLYLLFFWVNASLPIIGLDESGNQEEICGEIAAGIEDDGILIMDFNLGDLFGSPLRCIYGIENAWLKDNETLAGEEFAPLLEDLGFAQQHIYLLWRPRLSGDNIPLTGSLRAELVREYRFREESLEKSFEHRPSKREDIDEVILLFRLEPENSSSGALAQQ